MTKKADTNVFVIYYKNAVESLWDVFFYSSYLLGNHDATDSQKQKFFFTDGHFAAEIYTLHQNRVETKIAPWVPQTSRNAF